MDITLTIPKDKVDKIKAAFLVDSVDDFKNLLYDYIKMMVYNKDKKNASDAVVFDDFS